MVEVDDCISVVGDQRCSKDKRFFAERCSTPTWWRSATFSSQRAARLFVADETTTSIGAIHSKAELSSLWTVCKRHHLNPFDIYENHSRLKFTDEQFTAADRESVPLDELRR